MNSGTHQVSDAALFDAVTGGLGSGSGHLAGKLTPTVQRCFSLSPFDVHAVKGPPELICCVKVRCCLPIGHGGTHKGLDGSQWED